MTPEPGAFHAETYADPISPVLSADSPAAPSSPPPTGAGGVASELQVLVERFQKEGRVARVAGALPVQVPFPSLGPSVFLASELTEEGRPPSLSLAYKETTKGGL